MEKKIYFVKNNKYALFTVVDSVRNAKMIIFSISKIFILSH